MRDHLIGYLLDALDPAEQEMVEAELVRDPQLKRELEILSRSLLPLASDKPHHEPPPRLAERTCIYVVEQSARVSRPAPAAPVTKQWSLTDMVVAAGIFVAAAMLFLPAMNQSRFAARVTGCQNNLRQLGMAANNYSMLHNQFFPDIPLQGRLAAAGVVAVRLREMGFLSGSHLVICPASPLADDAITFRLPNVSELQAASEEELATMHRQMGGSYGYNLGYVSSGRYYSPRNLQRKRFALMADAPSTAFPYHSRNHGGCGQNVLFEDQHVEYLTTCRARGCRDDFYTNDGGQVDAGLHLHDSVLGASHCKPRTGAVLVELQSGDAQ